MAIDPMLYKKYNGRDATDLIGHTLASGAAAKQSRSAQKDRSAGERLVVGHIKAYWWKSVIGAVIVGVVLILTLV